MEVNHKGTWCKFRLNLFCQEGYCSECSVRDGMTLLQKIAVMMDSGLLGVYEKDGNIGFYINCNDIFCPAADAEKIDENQVVEVVELYYRNEDLMRWIATKRGYDKDLPYYWKEAIK